MSPRVLLVDDEANIRKMVGALLQSEGFETAEAPNGAAALATVEREAPDAVLLDLMMPGGPDGLETLEQLKRVAPDIPVVMMSGRASLTDAVRATKLGAFQFLEKPLTPEGVLTTLRAPAPRADAGSRRGCATTRSRPAASSARPRASMASPGTERPRAWRPARRRRGWPCRSSSPQEDRARGASAARAWPGRRAHPAS